ncbi:FAD-binding domain-containing protein [Apiospora arundinis]
MAADQALEWEVVDGTGNVLRATPSSHPDLYWALSGGGGGTYGIVSSVVVKLLPDVTAAGVQLKFRAKDPAKLEGFHLAVRTYHQLVPAITAAKAMGIAEVTNDTFFLTPLTLPASPNDTPRALLAPLIKELEKQGIAYSLNITEHPNRLQYWQQLITPNPTQLVQNSQYGGWFLSKEVVVEQADALQWAVREITDVGCAFVGLALDLNVSQTSMTTPQNSILPSWREASLSVTSSTYVHHCPSWPANGAS